MNIIICGAGEVGSHAAEVLAAAGHNITVIDSDADRLEIVGDQMDIGTLQGNAAYGNVLREAGAVGADMLISATNSDEINLLAASIGKAIGAKKSIARVHHSMYFEGHGIDYRVHFGIDLLICPEYSTATAIARTLRNPAALAIEQFAQGLVDMQEFPVSENAPALDKPLSQVTLPPGTRVATVARDNEVFIPDASTQVAQGDRVILVGNADVFYPARRLFHKDDIGRRKVVIMGGNPMSVWLCRALRERNWSIRLFETSRPRAEELADELDWVTVINADPTDRAVFMEENLSQADVFVALLDDDEANIIGCVLAKSLGVTTVVAVVQRPNYLDLLYHIGVDRPFSPRMVAVREIESVLDESPLRLLSSLAEGYIDVYRVKVKNESPIVGVPLRQVKLGQHWMIAAIRRKGRAWVPTADDSIESDDTVLVIGKHGVEKQLKEMFKIK